jgi:hypothetical protein
MEIVGKNIEKLDKILRENHPACGGRKWQLEAENLVNVAEFEKQKSDLQKLSELDEEAQKLIETWESKN